MTNAATDRRTTDVVLFRRLLAEARPFWLHLVGIFGLSLLATPLALLTPVPLKIAVDSVVGDRPLPDVLEAITPAVVARSDSATLLFAVGLLITVALLEQLQALARSVLGTYTGEKLTLAFRARLFRHVQRLSLAYHDVRGTADATYRIQYDAPAIAHVVIDALPPLVTATLTVLGMVYVTALIDVQLALVALAVIPVIVGLTWLSSRRLRPGWRDTKKIESSALAVVQEVLTSLRVVKAFGQEGREETRFLSQSGAGMRARVRLAVLEGGVGLLIGLTTAAGTAAVLFIGVRHVEAGTLTLGSLLLVMTYLLQLYAPLRVITRNVSTTLQRSLASAERAFALLDEPPNVTERPGARRIRRAAGAIEFADVSFSYGHVPVLADVTFSLERGTRLAVTGTTGAGKTTLASLLLRFYDPSGGVIRLDGIDLRDYALGDLREQFAVVLQEPVLFSTSIAENIAYARPDAAMDEIVDAAVAANAHEFIAGLADGYDSLVGERGMRLSGGERQRISLARAFLKDAPVLILDEPTSSVDARTELAIMDAMDRLMVGRTTLLIAHRLSTLRSCNAHLALERGRVVEFRRPEPPSLEATAAGPLARTRVDG